MLDAEAKEIKPTTFTIIATSHNDIELLLKGIELKIDKFLIQPINLDLLFEYISEFQAILENKDQLQTYKTKLMSLYAE